MVMKLVDSRRVKSSPVRAWRVVFGHGTKEDVWLTSVDLDHDYVRSQAELRYADTLYVEEIEVLEWQEPLAVLTDLDDNPHRAEGMCG